VVVFTSSLTEEEEEEEGRFTVPVHPMNTVSARSSAKEASVR